MNKKEKIFSLQYMVILVLGFTVMAVANTPPEEPTIDLTPDPLWATHDASCTAEYLDPEGDNGDMRIEWFVSGNSVQNQSWTDISSGESYTSYLNSSEYTINQVVLCNATVDDNIDDDINWSNDYELADTFPPEITSGIGFQNYTGEHAFNVSAEILDREGEDEIAQCYLEVTDTEGNIFRDNMTMNRDYAGEERVRCTYSNISNATSGFEVLEPMDVQVFANDSTGDTGNDTGVNPVPNTPPLIYNILPEDDSTKAETDIELKANFLDEDGEKIDVWFYNDSGSTPQLLNSSKNLSSGNYSSVVWEDLPSLRTFEWYIKASDGFENSTVNLRFRNLISSQFRVQTSFEHRYSSVVASENSTTVVPYRVENTATDQKSLRTTTTGLNSEFGSTGTGTVTYDLAPGQSRIFNIQVTPENTGIYDLTVDTENTDYEVSNTDTIKVNVRNPGSVSAEIPGIGLLQLLFLALTSSILFYSGRL